MRPPTLTPQVQAALAQKWEAWNPWEILRAFPPSFIRSLNLDDGVCDDPFFLGHAFLMAAGVESSRRILEVNYLATEEALARLRKQCTSGVRRLKELGRFCLRYPKATRHILINARLGERFTQDGQSLSENTTGVENFLMPGLPDDLSACLKSAVTCYLAISSLVFLAAPGFLRSTIAPLDSFERIRLSLQNAISELRLRTGMLAIELVAARTEVVAVAGAEYPSAHHAMLALAKETVEIIALCGTPLGHAIYVSGTIDGAIKPTGDPAVDLRQTIGNTFNRIQLSAIQIAMLQKEVGMAASARTAGILRIDAPHTQPEARLMLPAGQLSLPPPADVPAAEGTMQNVETLKPKYRKALDLIKGLSEPAKGQVIANRLGIHITTFQKHYVPALRPFGLRNERDGDGYFIDGASS